MGLHRFGGLLLGVLTLGASTLATAAPPAGTAGPGEDSLAPAVRQEAHRTFTVVAGGDILTENLVRWAGADFGDLTGARYDFAPVFAPVRDIVSWADLAICHQELPIGLPSQQPGAYGRSPFGGNLLLAPYELAAGIAATGFDRCSTASNHSNDLGTSGIASTLAAFDAAGLSHDGTARTAAEAVPDVFMVRGVRVGHVSYTRYSNTVRPADPWRLNYASTTAPIVAAVNDLRARGAEVVIVSLHLRQELLAAPLSTDRSFVDRLLGEADIDLVVQHGPHVVQPLEVVRGVPVFWSVGNFVSGMAGPGNSYTDPRTMDGLLAHVRFVEGEPGQFQASARPLLVCNERVDRIVHPARLALADPTTPSWLRSELTACVARTSLVLGDFD